MLNALDQGATECHVDAISGRLSVPLRGAAGTPGRASTDSIATHEATTIHPVDEVRTRPTPTVRPGQTEGSRHDNVRTASTDPHRQIDGRLTDVTRYCHDHRVLTLSAGTFGNVLRFLPPLTITDDLLDDAIGVLADAFAAL